MWRARGPTAPRSCWRPCSPCSGSLRGGRRCDPAPRHVTDGKLNDVDTMTTGEVAERLQVALPTVRQAARRLGLHPDATSGGHLRFSERDLAALVAELGVVPRVAGLTRPQVQVLAALARAPLGLRSERAVARAARCSPTAAGRALDALLDAGLVRHDARTFAEGKAVAGALWRIRPGRRWQAIAPAVAQTVLPAATALARPARLPRRFWHLFWNADPAALDLDADAAYIATRMLLSDDLQALAWACAHLPAEALRRAAANRAADPPTRAMIANVLAAA